MMQQELTDLLLKSFIFKGMMLFEKFENITPSKQVYITISKNQVLQTLYLVQSLFIV